MKAARGNHNGYSRRLFNGLNTMEVIEFLKGHPTITNLREFKNVFYAEKGRFNTNRLTKETIDLYLSRYMKAEDAAKELNMEYSNLVGQVEEHYDSWARGRKHVVIHAIIQSFRVIRGTATAQQIFKIFESVGYRSVNCHNVHTSRLFDGKFSKTKEAIEFFRTHPAIKTYEQFKAYFSGNKITGLDNYL